MTPFFSIVVPTFRRPEPLRRLLHAIAAQTFPRDKVEVVLVDDSGERQQVSAVVNEFAASLSIALRHTARLGPAPARLAGVEVARGSYLAFTDDDCVPAPDWLEQLHAAFQRNPQAAVGGRVRNGLPGNACAAATQVMLDLLIFDSNRRGQTKYVGTANIAFPAAALRQVQGLDATWRNWGGEDRELCRRWIESGRELVYLPELTVDHYHPLTLSRYWSQHFRYGVGSSQFHKNSGYQSPGFYPALLTAGFRFPVKRPIAVTALLWLAQLATACGFAVERMGRIARGKQSRSRQQRGHAPEANVAAAAARE